MVQYSNFSVVLASMLFFAISDATMVRAKTVGACSFDTQLLSFAGSPQTQAKCLLRKVMIGAEIGPNLDELPTVLAESIGNQVTFSKVKLRKYLSSKNISDMSLGGSIDDALSKAKQGNIGAPHATYFVIHDTSTPNCSDRKAKCKKLGMFPADMNSATSSVNNLQRWVQSGSPAHVFVNRVGKSVTIHDFSTGSRATKIEKDVNGGVNTRGLFLHIELVQPRIGSPSIPTKRKNLNDLVAPVPGFTNAQYDRLALLYVCASLRNGRWMIPAFHGALDKGISGGHDDPQNFDLRLWTSALQSLISQIEGS